MGRFARSFRKFRESLNQYNKHDKPGVAEAEGDRKFLSLLLGFPETASSEVILSFYKGIATSLFEMQDAGESQYEIEDRKRFASDLVTESVSWDKIWDLGRRLAANFLDLPETTPWAQIEEIRREAALEVGLTETASLVAIKDAKRKHWASDFGLPENASWDQIWYRYRRSTAFAIGKPGKTLSWEELGEEQMRWASHYTLPEDASWEDIFEKCKKQAISRLGLAEPICWGGIWDEYQRRGIRAPFMPYAPGWEEGLLEDSDESITVE